MKKALLFILLLALSACGHVDLSITDQTKIITDSPVRKSSLQVSVHPKGKQFRPLTAYFHPFVIQQQSSDYENLAIAFAQMFHNVWMEEQLFPAMEFNIESRYAARYEGLNAALNKARYRGADLLVLGSVPYFYAGHTVDDTAITIKMDIYDTATGTLLWSMIQSGRIEEKAPDDYIYFRHEYRMSDGAFNEIIRSMAKDMAIPLKAWLPDPKSNYRFARSTSEMEANLDPAANPKDASKATSIDGAKGGPKATEKDLAKDGVKGDAKKDDGKAARPLTNGVNLNINFDLGKATIQPKSYPILDALGEALGSPELKGKKIIVAGHTDNQGGETVNMALSKKRAQAVKTYLVNKWGMNPELVATAGYGSTRPITTGTTKEDLQKNRRVEIRLAQ